MSLTQWPWWDSSTPTPQRTIIGCDCNSSPPVLSAAWCSSTSRRSQTASASPWTHCASPARWATLLSPLTPTPHLTPNFSLLLLILLPTPLSSSSSYSQLLSPHHNLTPTSLSSSSSYSQLLSPPLTPTSLSSSYSNFSLLLLLLQLLSPPLTPNCSLLLIILLPTPLSSSSYSNSSLPPHLTMTPPLSTSSSYSYSNSNSCSPFSLQVNDCVIGTASANKKWVFFTTSTCFWF